MPGWRVGFMVGNPKLIGALAKIKSYLDYGTFTPIQVAAIEALESDQKYVNDIAHVSGEKRCFMFRIELNWMGSNTTQSNDVFMGENPRILSAYGLVRIYKETN